MMRLFWIVLVLAFLNEASGNDDEWTKFKKLFMEKRIHQLAAVKQLLTKTNKPEQTVKTVNEAMKKIKDVLVKNKAVLETSGFVGIENQILPEDQKVREALAFVIENTCFASDFLLRFPSVVHSALSKDGDLDVVYRWGLGFVDTLINDKTIDLFDEGTKKLMDLALMEMDIKEKSDDYQNRYSAPKETKKKKVGFVDPPAEPHPKRKPKKKLERGPRMSKTEL